MSKKKTNYTTLAVAAKWFGNNLIQLDMLQLADYFDDCCRFDRYEHHIEHTYLTDCTLPQVEFLEQHFDLLFGYSPEFNRYILCVDYSGDSWHHTRINTDIDNISLNNAI